MEDQSPPTGLRVLGIADANLSHTLKWSRYLDRRGYDLDLVSFVPVTEESRRALPASVRLADWTLPPFHLKRFWVTTGAVRRLRRLVAARRPDVVHAHFLSYGAWYGALAASKVPLVISVMGGDFTGTEWRPGSLRERFMTPLALRSSSLVLCWSSNLERIVDPLLGPEGRSEVLVGGVDLKRFAPLEDVASTRRALGLPEDDFLVFSPRIMRPLCHIETIVEAFRHVAAELPHARLVLLRYLEDRWPEYARRIDRRIEELGLASRVIMRPTIDNDDMPRYFAAVDCTVSMIETDGTPMTLLESMACGTPVVMLDLEVYDPELFRHGETVLKIERRDPAALAKALVDLGRADDRRRGLSERSRACIARRASYEGEMSRLEGFYHEVALGSRGRARRSRLAQPASAPLDRGEVGS